MEAQDAQATTAQTATTETSASSSFNTGASAFKVTSSAFVPGGAKPVKQEESFSFGDLAN